MVYVIPYAESPGLPRSSVAPLVPIPVAEIGEELLFADTVTVPEARIFVYLVSLVQTTPVAMLDPCTCIPYELSAVL